MDNILTTVTFIVLASAGFMYRNYESNKVAQHSPVAEQDVNGKSHFTVKAGDFDVTYSLGRPVNEDMLAVAVRPQRKQDTPLSDFHSQMLSFTSKASAKYVKKYPGSKYCPASFLNRNANHVDLYAANESVAKKLSQWKRLEYSDVTGWETVKFSGNCVKKRTKIMKGGEDVTKTLRLSVIGRKGSGDCLGIYVRSFDVRPADIFKT